MVEILEKLAYCIERGKIKKDASFPPDLVGQEGTAELTKQAIQKKIPPADILNALLSGMESIGIKFQENKAFVPEVLMAAKAMNVAMKPLTPFFHEGIVKERGVLVIGTVSGDLHDIGKNIVSMIIKGSGWKIIDLGTSVSAENFILAIDENPGCCVALSALLTTTMINMESTVKAIKSKYPDIQIMIGGAPVTKEFCKKIGADFYSAQPYQALDFLNTKLT